jgi:hypothetical protein
MKSRIYPNTQEPILLRNELQKITGIRNQEIKYQETNTLKPQRYPYNYSMSVSRRHMNSK